MPVIAEFLLHCFRVENLSVKTVQGYKAALTAKLKPMTGVDLSKCEILSQLIHSFFRSRPPPDKRVLKWDINVVLRFMKVGAWAHTETLSARNLTLKLVFLLTLAAGKRCGEIHALANSVFKVRGNWQAVQLRPRVDFIGKTHYKTNGYGTFEDIVIPSLTKEGGENDTQSLCPVQTLRHYLSESKKYRGPEQKRLIISWVPGKQTDITKQAISNYLRLAVVEAYKDVENVEATAQQLGMRPHDIRGVATSLQTLTACRMEDILRAGVWTSPSTFISHYVKEFTCDQLTGLHQLAPFVVGASVF